MPALAVLMTTAAGFAPGATAAPKQPKQTTSKGKPTVQKTAKTAASLTLIDAAHKPIIVISPRATASEKYAATELSTYLGKISGQQIAVQETDDTPASRPLIILGHHAANAVLKPEKLELEETSIEVKPGVVRIVGGALPPLKLPSGQDFIRDRGTLYAAYDFLDSLGVRWYRPDPWGEYVPKMPVVKVPVGHRSFKPVFRYRYGFNAYRNYTEQTTQQRDLARIWGTRNRQNTEMWPDAEFGGYYSIQTSHSYPLFWPSSQNFEAHPEYYALIDGKRRPDGQLCLGNVELQKATAAKLIAYAKANPQFEMLSLEPDDHDRWCQCELCKAMDDPKQLLTTGELSIPWENTLRDEKGNLIDAGNRVVGFAAKVAEIVARTNPEIVINWLSYSSHSEVPSRIKKLPANTAVQACAFSSAFSDPQESYSDYSRDLYDPASKPNRNFVRVLEGYSKMTSMTTYEYWSGIAWVGPMPLVRTMQDRLKAYHKLGLQGVRQEVHQHWGPQGLDHYFFTRLMWDPHMDVKKELDLYYTNYYGPAAKPMKEYHELLEKAAHSGIPFYSYGIGTHAIFTPKVIQRMGELMGQAKKLTGEQQPYRQRLEGVWAGYEYTRLVKPYHGLLARGEKLEAAKHWERANRFILSFKNGDTFDNGILFGSLQFFGNYNLNIPAEIQAHARQAVADEPVSIY